MTNSINPKFDFSTSPQSLGDGQSHTTSKVRNNNLAPVKFNEYERIMSETADLLGDCNFAANILDPNGDPYSGLESNVGGAITFVANAATAAIASLFVIISSLDDLITEDKSDLEDFEDAVAITIAGLESDITDIETDYLKLTGGTLTGDLSITGTSGLYMYDGADKFVDIRSTSATIGKTTARDYSLHVYGEIDTLSVRLAKYSSAYSYSQNGLTVKERVSGDRSTIELYTAKLYTTGVSFAPSNWDLINSRPAYQTVVEDSIDTDFLKEIKDPIGTIKMYDGASWVDNVTIPGYYACDGTDGTPNLVDSFIIGTSNSILMGTFGGANAGGNKHNIILADTELPSHEHAMPHTHIVDLTSTTESGIVTSSVEDEHIHAVDLSVYMNEAGAGTGLNLSAFTATGSDEIEASMGPIDGYPMLTFSGSPHDHTIDLANYSGVVSNAPDTPSTSAFGVGDAIDITPYHYKLLLVKRMA